MEKTSVNYKIYQTNNHDFIFMDYDWAKEHGFNLDEYKKVYSGSIEVRDTDHTYVLDEIYTELNIRHPEDYHARSLSVSDIVEFDDGTMWYVDGIGFTQIR